MNNLLDGIDSFLNKQKESESQLFFILPILLFGFVSYFLIYPVSDQTLKTSVALQKKLNQKIQKVNNSINQYKINNKVVKQALKD